VKARKVKGLRPGKPLRANAKLIVRTRLEELLELGGKALEPGAVEAQHDLRIAAKRLRYVLEIVGPCLGPEVRPAQHTARELQTVLGGVHDCDEMLPRAQGIPTLEFVLRTRRELLLRRFLEIWDGAGKGALVALRQAL
jgi:CHAD domain-containing protein